MRKNNCNYIPLIISVLILLVYHIFGYIGHFGYDDMHYAEISARLLNGTINFNDHFSFRFPLILLTSLSYFIFGISDFASSLPALIISVLTLILVFDILKKEGIKQLIIGLSLVVLSNWYIFYSDKLMTDIYLTFFVMLSVYIIYKYKFSYKNKNTVIYSALFVLSLLLGFSIKGTVVLIFPLLIYYFIVDIRFKRDIKFWKFTVIFGIVVLIFYFIVVWALTGDFLKRFDAIASNSYLNLCSYSKQPFKILLKRIGYEFFSMMIYQMMATGFIFVIASVFDKNSFKHFKLDNAYSFFWSSSVILLLSSNFMTISLTSYSPMCIDPRHYLFLIPVVAIPASSLIIKFIETKRFRFHILAVSIVISIISYFILKESFWQLYFPLTVLIGVYILVKPKPVFQNLFLAVFIIIIGVKPYNMIKYAQKIKYNEQKRIVYDNILNKKGDYTVITNVVQKRLCNYYAGFNTDNIKFISYDQFVFDSSDISHKILLLNWYSRYLSGQDYSELPYFARNAGSNNKLIYENKDLNIAIYEMSDFNIPEINGKKLFYSLNDFENNTKYWKQNDNNITDKVKYSGDKSYGFSEYSATFQYPIDSMEFSKNKTLLIRCNLFCNFDNKTDAKIVVSVEDTVNSYFWKGISISKYIRAYSNWWKVPCEVEINSNDIKKGSVLKIYLWNANKKTAYIDDFKIEIYELEERNRKLEDRD